MLGDLPEAWKRVAKGGGWDSLQVKLNFQFVISFKGKARHGELAQWLSTFFAILRPSGQEGVHPT